MADAVIDFPRHGQSGLRPPAAPAAPGTGKLDSLFALQRAAYAGAGPLTVDRRAAALKALAGAVKKYQEPIVEAVRQDFGHRSPHETRLAEVVPILKGIAHTLANLRRWTKPRSRPIDPTFWPGRGKVVYQPLGVVGIVSPWNYPVQLALMPLTAAIAAGNRVLLKPSEYTPRTADLLERLLAEVFEPAEVAVVQGGPDVAQAFCRLKFDHLLFTGSTAVGRQVMQAAAANLVPVTLELGGKSPAILAPDADLAKAAESIATGKLFNAGQTCIAPDYVLLPRGREDAFIQAFADAARRMYPGLSTNPDYTAIVNDRHHRRLTALLEEAERRGATLHRAAPDGVDPTGRRMGPVLVTGAPDDTALMQDEIFGPILPLVPYDSLEAAIGHVNARPRPLALYVFGEDGAAIDRVLDRTVSGGVTVNDTLLHCVQEELPFGGVGDSGIGAYHGEAGFRTFSHAKGVFTQSRFNLLGMMRPPYGPRVDRMLKFLIGKA